MLIDLAKIGQSVVVADLFRRECAEMPICAFSAVRGKGLNVALLVQVLVDPVVSALANAQPNAQCDDCSKDQKISDRYFYWRIV